MHSLAQETLADPGAYLASGSISRYHNPDHYTLAFGRIIHLRRQVEDSTGAARVPRRGLRGRDSGAWEFSDDAGPAASYSESMHSNM